VFTSEEIWLPTGVVLLIQMGEIEEGDDYRDLYFTASCLDGVGVSVAQ
jgi:hypothetical protein